MVNWEGRRESSNVLDLREKPNLGEVAQEVWARPKQKFDQDVESSSNPDLSKWKTEADEAWTKMKENAKRQPVGQDGQPILPGLDIVDSLNSSVNMFGSKLVRNHRLDVDTSENHRTGDQQDFRHREGSSEEIDSPGKLSIDRFEHADDGRR